MAADERAAVRHDLNNEQAGRVTGRIQRHGTRDDNSPEGLKRKRERDAAFQNALERLLLEDPIYAARYHRAERFLSTAESIADQAIQSAISSLSGIETAHAALLDRANRLPDGRHVFRAADGRIVDIEGNTISPVDAASLQWRSGAPSFADVQRSRKALENAKLSVEELQSYRVDVLGTWRDRIDDEDDPITPEELDQLEADIIEKSPQAIRPTIELQDEVGSNVMKPSLEIEVPRI